MKLSMYQAEARRTLTLDPSRVPMLLAVMGLGLAGESGEVIEHLKKHVGHGHDLDRAKVRKELGDVLWYVAAIATLVDLDLDDVALANVAKLRERYPQGFTHEASRNRAGES